jgi:hypothetical protein
MSTRLPRILTALCGILGVAALVAHFSIPAQVPPANATVAQVTEFAKQDHATILVSAWLEGIGSLLFVLFVLAIVHLAAATTRFAGWITMLAAAVILAVSLLDVTFYIAVVQAAASGHPATAAISFDLISDLVGGDAVGHVFVIAPPLSLPLGAVILGSRILPRVFGYLAVAFGVAIVILGCAGLFSATADTVITFVLSAQELWIVAAAITLIVRVGKPAPAGRGVAQPVAQASPES